MKNTILTLILFVFIVGTAQAQTYKLNKQVYSSADYVSQPNDRYDPELAAISSVFIPGLGQMISGEVGRGFAILGGVVAAYATTLTGVYFILNNSTPDENQQSKPPKYHGLLGTTLLSVGGIGGIILYIWNIFDAAHVAKINNMYYQDMRGNLRKLSIEVNPFIDTNTYLGTINTSAGLSLKVTF